jgi:hypothetical protein
LRVQTPGRRADQLLEALFHIEVDVLELLAKREGPGFDLLLDGCKAALDLGLVRLGDDPLRGQHRGVRPGAGEILGGQPPVEADGDVDRLHQRVGLAGEPAAP